MASQYAIVNGGKFPLPLRERERGLGALMPSSRGNSGPPRHLPTSYLLASLVRSFDHSGYDLVQWVHLCAVALQGSVSRALSLSLSRASAETDPDGKDGTSGESCRTRHARWGVVDDWWLFESGEFRAPSSQGARRRADQGFVGA